MSTSVEELSERMKTAMESIRSGETNGVLENNVDMDTRGRQVVYKDPPDREPGTINALWGDKPVPTDALNYLGTYGTGTIDAARDTREGVLERAFSGLSEARSVAKKEIAAYLEHGASGQYESRSTLLGKEKTAASSHVVDEGSLSDRVLSVTGYR